MCHRVLCSEFKTSLDTNLNNYEIEFDLSYDTLAFLHIQKTSGSFWIDEIQNNLLAHTDLHSWSNVCLLNVCRWFWNFYEFFGCDIHAGYNELSNCLDNVIINIGKLHMITILRNPLDRYVSEFQHVKRGATWERAVRACNEQPIYSNSCYSGFTDWSNVSWNDFLGCEYNLANNRQVRMLANYNELGCDRLKCWLKSSNCSLEMKIKYEDDLLENAKKNLLAMSFFGLTEYQSLSQYLFEKTFKNKFKFAKPFSVNKNRLGSKLLETVYKSSINEIEENNHLDVKLYEFATKIFFQRVSHFQSLVSKKDQL